MDIQQIDQQYVAGTYGRFPVEIAYGRGELIYDVQGKEYIDMGSGIAVNIFGMADESWQKAVIQQLGLYQHTSNLYYTQPCALLAKALCERTGFRKVFFSNSGAEANECAIKAARKYAADKKGPEHSVIVTLENSFHGRTITTLAATGQEVYHKDFLPLTPGFVYAKANDLNSIKEAVAANQCAAIMIETVQGEGGVNVLSQEFVEGIYQICQQEDILLIVDEVQTGNGRTGKLYSYMNYNIMPDIITTAKGLGGGLPLGATLLGEKVQDVFHPGDHGSTFGGNPVCCAGALNILSRLDDGMLELVRKKSQYIQQELNGAKGVKSVTGMGLMLGIETEKDAGQVIQELREAGVLVLKAKNKVRLLPPLNISMQNLKKAVELIKKVCA